MDAAAFNTLLQNVGVFFNQVLNWCGSVLDTITDQPILMLFVVLFPVAGYVIGYLNRLLRA